MQAETAVVLLNKYLPTYGRAFPIARNPIACAGLLCAHVNTFPTMRRIPHHGLGLLLIGTGGGEGAPVSANSFLFGGGGGGGFFFPTGPAALGEPGGGRMVDAPALPVAMPLTLSTTPYFWFNPLAALYPAAACSPCLSRKLLAVEAALRMSLNETDVGSLWKDLAVLTADCFCAKVVPPPGLVAGWEEPVFRLANLD